LCAALFSVGKDALLDDALFLHARWAAAGHKADLAVYRDGALGFTPVPNGLEDKASVRKDRFLRAGWGRGDEGGPNVAFQPNPAASPEENTRPFLARRRAFGLSDYA
jgi:hypothetical protein